MAGGLGYNKIYGTAYNRTNEEEKARLLNELIAGVEKNKGVFKCEFCGIQVESKYRDIHIGLHQDIINKQENKKVQQKGVKLKSKQYRIQEAIDIFTAAVKEIGWEIEINPAIAFDDRRGQQIIVLPAKEKENVPASKET